MKIRMREYRRNQDFTRIREFLQKVFLLNDRRDFSWLVQRLGVSVLRHAAAPQPENPINTDYVIPPNSNIIYSYSQVRTNKIAHFKDISYVTSF
jgi:hypothetical protein